MRIKVPTTLSWAAALVWTATAASAGAVSNREGDCWHVGARRGYRPKFGLRVHPRSQQVLREREGRGYWRNDAWIEF